MGFHDVPAIGEHGQGQGKRGRGTSRCRGGDRPGPSPTLTSSRPPPFPAGRQLGPLVLPRKLERTGAACLPTCTGCHTRRKIRGFVRSAPGFTCPGHPAGGLVRDQPCCRCPGEASLGGRPGRVEPAPQATKSTRADLCLTPGQRVQILGFFWPARFNPLLGTSFCPAPSLHEHRVLGKRGHQVTWAERASHGFWSHSRWRTTFRSRTRAPWWPGWSLGPAPGWVLGLSDPCTEALPHASIGEPKLSPPGLWHRDRG